MLFSFAIPKKLHLCLCKNFAFGSLGHFFNQKKDRVQAFDKLNTVTGDYTKTNNVHLKMSVKLLISFQKTS